MKLRNLFILALTFMFSLGGGFLFGAFPDKTWFVLKKQVTVVGLPPEMSLPPLVQKAIFELSGEVLISKTLASKDDWEKQSYDFAIVPRSWLEKDSVDILSDFFKNDISNDFLLREDSDLKALPLFWKADKSGSLIHLLYLTIQNPFRIQGGLRKALLSPVVQSLWTQNSGWSTTLSTLDELNISEELKALNVRKFLLSQLSIEPLSQSVPPPPTTTTTLPATKPAAKSKRK